MLVQFIKKSQNDFLRKSLHKFRENKLVKKLMLIIYKKLSEASIGKIVRA